MKLRMWLRMLALAVTDHEVRGTSVTRPLTASTRDAQVFRVRHKISGEPFAVKRSRCKFASRAHRKRCCSESLTAPATQHDAAERTAASSAPLGQLFIHMFKPRTAKDCDLFVTGAYMRSRRWRGCRSTPTWWASTARGSRPATSISRWTCARAAPWHACCGRCATCLAAEPSCGWKLGRGKTMMDLCKGSSLPQPLRQDHLAEKLRQRSHLFIRTPSNLWRVNQAEAAAWQMAAEVAAGLALLHACHTLISTLMAGGGGGQGGAW